MELRPRALGEVAVSQEVPQNTAKGHAETMTIASKQGTLASFAVNSEEVQ